VYGVWKFPGIPHVILIVQELYLIIVAHMSPAGSAAVRVKARELVGSRATVTVMDVWRAASPGDRLTFTLGKLPSWELC
jgi:hypothetical protein